VAGDAGSVGGDAGSVRGDAGSVSSDLTQLRNAIATTGADFDQYQTDQRTLPSYQPANPPAASDVSIATTAADKAVAAALAATNGDIDQANNSVTVAFQYAAMASQAGNCGGPPQAPAPQSHIS
jgi:hypothetical protein